MKLPSRKTVTLVLCAIVACGVSYYAGRTTAPTKIQEVERTVEKNNVVTVVRTIKQPNGTEETITTTTDKSTKNQSAQMTTPMKVTLDRRFDLGAEYSFIDSKQIYSATVSKRITGGLWLGISAKTNGTLGVVGGFEF